ncbi:hypothetical protein PGIGA_G00148940 [Pangasianodon gigas]|uniref:Uncharacterized protein n=1 Tax=Pangasianodon gigas TaxID=30993 RepID=A0ACC5XND8_PANGG|nr:hypothetical protein [Pangasianodon gigas]
MMRRSRISVKPNFRPGSRTATEGEQVSQGVSEASENSPAVEAEVPRPAPSHQQNVGLIVPSEDVAIKDAPEMPSKMIQNDGAPSSGATTSSAAPHRRMRISATPKLFGPKPTSTPRAQPSARMPSSAPSPLPNEEHVQIHDSASEAPASVSIMSNDLSESGAPRKSTSPTNLPTQSSTMTQSSSPCVPSTSGLRKSPVHEKKSVEGSPPSPQPGQVPQQPPQEPEPPDSPSSSDLSSVCFEPSQFDKAGSSEMVEKSSDKDRILRALKLKELMKIERRKDIQMGKRRVGHKEYTALDRSKMTMRDLIYYLPNTSPMRSSIAHEENQEETIIPPSPKQQIKTAEGDEEEEEESENEEMLVPKVRVAEDGSIILDEESLTVRVQRTSNTKALEDSTALFERGSTTTYSSFRTLNYVKSWSVRETDLFFLAISMVGTDFSLIGQLLTHRSRAAIKSKFKKEERLNPWRVDKALRNKRPYDKEFFSYLLEKILAKDKDKRKSVKLILPKTKKPRKSKGKTSNKLCVSDDDGDDVFHMDDHEDLEDDEEVSVEKENEDVSNVKEADTSVPAKKRRKRTRDVSKDKDNSTEEQVKRKRQRKCSKKTTKEVHSKDDTEGEHDINVEGDTINVNKEDELERSTSASKRRRKRSKNDEEKQNGKPVKGTKGKNLKKSHKVVCDQEESVSEHEESSIRDEDGSATKKKRKRAKNSDLDVDEPAKGKKNTKRKKAPKIEEEGTAEEGEASAALQEAEQLNALVTAEVADNVPPKATRRSKKPLPNLATTRSKKSNEPEASAEVERESQDENIHESILTAAGSPSEDEKLQMQAVVVLEKTPPRHQNVLSPSKVQCKNNELEPSVSSPASPSSSESSSTQQTRMQRAGRAKRNLSTSGKTGRKTGMMDQDQADPESPMVLLEPNQESEGEEGDNSLNENLINLSCLRDLDSQMIQRRPMVVLSREEVDMILDASDQSADEDPSVSPLDLSLNTELSFPLQCSKLLEDNDEEDEVDCVFEEHEERTNERASCEERNCEELELTESALAQPDISNLRDSSTSLTPEVYGQPEVGLSKVTTPMEEAEPQVHPMACKAVSTEKLLYSPATDQHGALEDFSKQNLTKEEETSHSNTVDQMESESTKDLSDASTAVPDQENITAVTLSPASADEPQAQPDMSNLRDISTSLTPEVCGQPEVGLSKVTTPMEEAEPQDHPMACKGSPPLVVLDNVDPICMKPDAPMTQETITTETTALGTSLLVSDIMEESEKAMLPTLLKESALASSEIIAQSKLTPTGSGLGSHRSLQAAPEVKGELQKSLAGPSQTLETLQDSSEIEEGTQESALASPEIKARTQGCAVAPEVKEDSQEEVSVESRPTRRSRFQKPKPNLSQKSRVLQNQGQDLKTPSTLKPKSSEPTVSTEKLLYSPATDQHGALEDFSKQNLIKEEETSQSNTVDRMESESTKDLSDTSTAVPDQENITAVTLSPASADEPQVASECSSSRCDVDMVPPCTSVTSPQPSQTGEDTGTGQMIVPSEDVCAPAEIVHLTEDGDKEPTFILTLYEIPVTQTYLPSSSNDSVMTSDLPTFETQASLGFSDQAHTLPSTSESSRIDSPLMESIGTEKVYSQNDLGVVTKGLAENGPEQISAHATSHEITSPHTKDEDSDASANLEIGIPPCDPHSECKKSSEFAPLDDLAPRTSGYGISKCITALPQDSEDTEQCERVSHMVLADVFVPVSEDTGDDSSKDRTMAVESKKASSVSVTEDLAENVKEQTSSQEHILLDTKDEESDASANLETGIPHMDPDSECKKGSEFAPLEDLASGTQSTPSRFNISKCIETLPQDSEDTEQCESVSHMVLGDIFVPVSEETGDDSSKDRTMAVECKLHSKEASSVGLPERQDTPYEELTKVENSPAVSNPLLCFDFPEESKDTPPLSEEKKAPARRRERQIKPQPKLVKRARAKDVSSKTDQLVKEPSQPTYSRVVLPASHEENLAGISNTTDEKSVDRMSSIRGNKTSVSRGKEVKPKSIAEESPKMSQSDSEPTDSKPVSAALHLSKEPKLEEENSENVTGDTTIKDDMESSAEDKELSILTSNEGENVQPSCDDMNFSLMKTSGSGSSTVGSEETEAEPQGVSHMVLPDVFVLVSDETEDALCNDLTVSIESSPQRVSLPKKSGAHIQKELKTEAVSQTLIEESTQNQSPLMDIKTPVRKRGKQEVKRTCAKNDLTGTRLSQPTSPQATTPSSQLTTLPRNENMVLLEEKLQRRHHIMPCTVRLSSLDTVAQSLRVPQLGDRKGDDVMSSPTCHASVTNVSEESSTPSLFEGMKLEDPELEKKSPTRRKGKKNESSPDTKRGHLKPVQTISQTRQLTITDWAKKKSHQTATNQEEEEPEKSSQMQSSLKAKEMHLMVEKTCSKSQHTDSEEPEGSHLVPALEETEEVSSVSKEVNRSSDVAKESNEDPSVSQVKKSPARRRAKLQVKPILSKKACTKSEGNTLTTDQPQPTRFTSPTRQHAQAAREMKESDNKTKLPVKEVTSTSSVDANSKSTESSSITSGPQSPISQDTWPRVVLPRVKLWTTEAGVCSASSTPTSSPARVSESVSPPVTPPQLKNSPTQSSSPTASENPDDDPSRVSQFFLCDIFTEVEEAE